MANLWKILASIAFSCKIKITVCKFRIQSVKGWQKRLEFAWNFIKTCDIRVSEWKTSTDRVVEEKQVNSGNWQPRIISLLNLKIIRPCAIPIDSQGSTLCKNPCKTWSTRSSLHPNHKWTIKTLPKKPIEKIVVYLWIWRSFECARVLALGNRSPVCIREMVGINHMLIWRTFKASVLCCHKSKQ